MKKALAALLATIMVMTVVGCGNSDPSKGTTNNSAVTSQVTADSAAPKELKGEITFSTWGSLDEKKVNEEVITAFEAKYPGTKVNLEYIPENYREKIDTMFLGGNAPDVIYGHPHYFATWAKQGLLMDLTGKFEKEKDFYFDKKFATNMYDSFKWEDKNMATINGHDTYLLYYNKNMFDAAGVSYPTDKWTWDDFRSAAKKLTVMNGKNKQYGTTIGNWAPSWFPIIYSFGGNIFDNMDKPTKVVFNSPETVEALQFIRDIVLTDKSAPSYMSSELIGGAFDTGRAAMDIEGSWAPAGRKNIKDFKWDMANVPLKSGKDRRTSAYYAGYAVNAQTKNPDLAYEFAKYFQTDEGQGILSKLGLITVINKEIASSDKNLKAPGMPENHKLRVSSIDYATNGYALTTNWEEMIAKVLKPAFDNFIANKITAEQCAQEVQKGLEELLVEAQK